jgi:hypothetical protein
MGEELTYVEEPNLLATRLLHKRIHTLILDLLIETQSGG